jgi:sugar lactone lactonase YvrE
LLAGLLSGKGYQDGSGSTARFNLPTGVAVGPTGDIYVADQVNNRIRRITPAGVVSTLVTGGTTSLPSFFPTEVAVDATGNIYVLDQNNHMIWKVSSSGTVTPFAGSPESADAKDGTGTDAHLVVPTAIAIDKNGNLFVGDPIYNKIRKITPGAVVTTLVPAYGFLVTPRGLAVDANGNLFVAGPAASGGNWIQKLTPAGELSLFAGGPSGLADGPGTNAQFSVLAGLAMDGDGNMYVADAGNNAIRKIAPSGDVTTVAGSGPSGSANGQGAAARFYSPVSVAVGPSGNIYVADKWNDAIRAVTPGGAVTTLAGMPLESVSADGSNGAETRFNGFLNPSGVAPDGLGNLYVADGNAIRKVNTSSGAATTVASVYMPHAMMVSKNRQVLYFTLPQAYAVYVMSLSPSGLGSVSNFVGGMWGSDDGTGSAAKFAGPQGLAMDDSGYIYVADSGNGTIRKILPTAKVTTLAGTAGQLGSDDGTGPAARFTFPESVAADRLGNVYVADSMNDTVRKITPAGVVTTLTRAVKRPVGVATDGQDNVYVADTGNNAIRKITPSGELSTVVGVASPYSRGNFPGPLPASLFEPRGLAVDPSTGYLYISLDSAILVAELPAH